MDDILVQFEANIKHIEKFNQKIIHMNYYIRSKDAQN